MTFTELAITFMLAAGLTAMALPVLISQLSIRNVIDRPTDRSSHSTDVPRGGGLAILIAVAMALAYAMLSAEVPLQATSWALLCIAALSFLGLWDDLRGLTARLRLSLQLLTASIFVLGVQPQFPTGVSWLDYALGVLWVAGIVNVFNFMDGINGVSAMTAIVAGVAISLASRELAPAASLLAIAAAGGGLGFAPFNTPRARVFLGDVGSYGLGATLATSAYIARSAEVPLVLLLLPFAVYVGDVGLTLFHRALQRERLTEPHRSHAYQKLANGSLGHFRTAIFVATLTFTFSLVGAAVASASLPIQLLGTGGVGATTLLYWRLPELARLLGSGNP